MLSADSAHDWVRSFEQMIAVHRDELTELDRQSGDGDFGTNVSSACARAVSLLSNSAATPAGAFLALSDGFLNTGGTSGPLFAMWFRGPADAAADSPVLTLDRFVTGSEAGLTAVQRLGKARVGDKTMVDGIAPALVALRSAAADGLDLAAAVGSAALAARSGALATAGQLARRGRASYVGAAAKGVVDAGALAVALFYESVPR